MVRSSRMAVSMDLAIGDAGEFHTHELDIETCGLEDVGTLERNILVGQQSHGVVFGAWLTSRPSSMHSCT